ncbi:hypothetical protein [Pseudoalteromonas sp. C8]|uniref:hypothetical protein n=1 Tax=Pseudoalteromonas sp. C8 TaxID=2686345 RepID=UPI0013FDAB7D|nr:hypothetical protein [Pseudoalteromonas sp. C8]
MSNNKIVYVVSAVLLFIAGIIVGQGFNFEVELKDVLALGATLGTLFYASNGLRHNRKIYMSSITPVIERFIALDDSELSYNFSLKNYGTGSAINIKYKVFRGDEELTVKTLQTQILAFDKSNGTALQIGAELGISANSSLDILTFSTKEKEVYECILTHLRKLSLEVTYSSIQGDKTIKVFSLVP